MSNLGKNIRQHIPANSKFAKSLTAVYFMWLFVVLTLIINSNKATGIILLLSIIGSFIPVFISTLHEGIYGVQFYGGGKKRRQAYLGKMDKDSYKLEGRYLKKATPYWPL